MGDFFSSDDVHAHESSSGGVSTRHLDEAELLDFVREALGRYAIAQSPRLEGDSLVLHYGRARALAPLGRTLERWPRLDASERTAQAARLARQLADLRPATSHPPTHAQALGRSLFGPRSALVPLVVAVGLFGFAYLGYRTYEGEASLGGAAPASGNGEPEPGAVRPPGIDRRAPPNVPAADAHAAPGSGRETRLGRASRVCAESFSRAAQGQTIGLADSEGWVVDYLAWRAAPGSPLTQHAALAKYVATPHAAQGSRYVWKEEPELSGVETSDDLVTVSAFDITGSGPAAAGVRLTFAGALTDAYFRAETRGRYVHLASELSRDLGATHAALFARCFDGTAPQVGAWFFGIGDGEALTALLFSLGALAEPPHLAPLYVSPAGAADAPLDRAFSHAAIARVSALVERPLLAQLLGQSGGLVTGRPGEGTVILFPFDDSSRASRVSRALARAMHLGI